jgi:hypothetical protein
MVAGRVKDATSAMTIRMVFPVGEMLGEISENGGGIAMSPGKFRRNNNWHPGVFKGRGAPWFHLPDGRFQPDEDPQRGGLAAFMAGDDEYATNVDGRERGAGHASCVGRAGAE